MSGTIPHTPALPRHLLAPLRQLFAGEKNLHVVGGSLRDLAMGRTPADIDIVVPGAPERVAGQIAGRIGGRPVRLGKGGLFIYRVAGGARVFDIAAAAGGSIGADLARRDFTVNAMAWDLAAERLVDPYGGMADLAAGTIRAVSDTVFAEDPLRMLRAFRLAATLDFIIDPATEALIARFAGHIDKSAAERIHDELFKLFAVPRSAPALATMERSGLLCRIFPELAPLAGCTQGPPHDKDVLAHTLAAYAHLEALAADGAVTLTRADAPPPALAAFDPVRQGLLKCAVLLHDIGKPAVRTVEDDGRVRFHGHSTAGAQLAGRTARRLAFSNSQRRYVQTVIAAHLRPLSLFLAHERGQLTPRGTARFFRACRPLVPDLLLHAAADMRAKAAGAARTEGFEAFVRRMLVTDYPAFAERAARPRLVTGNELMDALGLAPSPVLGRILARIEEARLSGAVKTRAEALALARRLRESIS